MHKPGLRVWDRVFGWKRRAEARATLQHAGGYLRVGDSVLDVGCGVGYALDILADEFNCTTFGCDVVAPPDHITNFAMFDGRRLPYRDDSVDLALLTFVLHHADDPTILLREASRVARRAVIVVEDTPRNPVERRWGALHIHNFSRRHKIPWLGVVRDEADWRRLFQSMDMAVLRAERLGRFERLPPVSRTTFVLAPAAQVAKAPKPERAPQRAVTS